MYTFVFSTERKRELEELEKENLKKRRAKLAVLLAEEQKQLDEELKVRFLSLRSRVRIFSFILWFIE